MRATGSCGWYHAASSHRRKGHFAGGWAWKAPSSPQLWHLMRGSFAISVRLLTGMCLVLLGSRPVWSAASRCLPGGACGGVAGVPGCTWRTLGLFRAGLASLCTQHLGMARMSSGALSLLVSHICPLFHDLCASSALSNLRRRHRRLALLGG